MTSDPYSLQGLMLRVNRGLVIISLQARINIVVRWPTMKVTPNPSCSDINWTNKGWPWLNFYMKNRIGTEMFSFIMNDRLWPFLDLLGEQFRVDI